MAGMAGPGTKMPARRTFLRALATGAGVALALAWGVMGRESRKRKGASRVSLPRPSGDGITFHGDVVLVSTEGKVTALSARCPHLGCRIARADGGVLVCPCHGSRFDPSGRRLAGPATSDLSRLVVAPSKEAGKVDVDVPS